MPSSGLLIVIAAVTALAMLALVASGKVTPARLLVCILIGLSGFFSLCMALVVYFLSEDLFRGVAMPSPPSGGTSDRAGQPSGNDAITNALTAISAVVAVLTLVLTVGATWFAHILQRLQTIREQLENELKNVVAYRAERSAHDELVAQTRDALVNAKNALALWISEVGGAASGNSIQEWALKLEMLSASSRTMRFQAYASLQVLAPRGLGDPVDTILLPVEQYTKWCDRLVRERLLFGGASASSLVADVENGLWCLVFDPIERTRYEIEMQRQ